MNKYGKAAVEAVKNYKAHPGAGPRAAWEQATANIFGAGTSSQEKGCPRDTFLGLCEEGVVADIPAGSYTRSRKNKAYALRALSILHRQPALAHNKRRLWEAVMQGEKKAPNSQMDVVAALWQAGLLS